VTATSFVLVTKAAGTASESVPSVKSSRIADVVSTNPVSTM
jgi:hypothetical protein